MSESKTLVIIVTYNGMKWLERCLNSVVNSSIPLDAYIVDNGSIDGSQEFITSNYPQFTFLQSPTNTGFGAANNIGLEHAIEQNYDYVYLLNQDAWVMPNTIATLIEVNKNNSEFGVLSPLQTNAEANTLDKNFTSALIRNSQIVSDAILNVKNDVYEIPFVMAAHWLISKKCFKIVGLFSPVFFHYGEDINYLHRVSYFKFKAGIVSKAIGVHDREFRPITKKMDVSRLANVMLTRSSDINQSFVKSLLLAYLSLIKASLRRSLKYKDITIFLIQVFRIYPIYKIYNYRKITEKKYCK